MSRSRSCSSRTWRAIAMSGRRLLVRRVAEAQVNLFAHVRRAAPGLPTEDHDAG